MVENAGKIYAIGGYRTGFLFTVEEYDPATNVWTARANLGTPRYSFGVAASDGVIYAVGGFRGIYLNTVETYDPESNPFA